MKKKLLTTGLVAVMAMTMLTGCAEAEDYKKDIEEICSLSEVDTDNLDVEELQSAVEDMKLTTPEGKDLKEDMVEYVNCVVDVYSDISALTNMSEEELNAQQAEIDGLLEDLDKSIEAFEKAAKKAGVTEDELSEMSEAGMLGL